MKRLLFRLCIFTAMVLVLALIFDFGLTRFFNNETATKAGKIFHLKDRKDDFVILGNSRVLINADADSIHSITGLKGYNLGLDGSNLMHQYLMLEQYFRHNSAKQVLLNLDPWGIQQRLSKLQRIYIFVPRLEDDTIFHHLKSTYGRRVYLWKYIPMFKYSLFNARTGILAALGIETDLYKEPVGAYGDYLKVNSNVMKTREPYQTVSIKIRPEVMRYYMLIGALCRKHQATLKLYISPVYTPFYRKHHNIDSVITIIQNSCNAQLINFCDSLFCKDKNMFYDHHHLNRSGRSKFTPLLAKYIQTQH